MVDGVYFAEHCCVVALGIGSRALACPLALEEGATENATLVRELLVGLRERGLDVSRPLLVVIDGSKALRRAVLDVFDQPVIQRASSTRSATSDKLPERLRRTVERRMRRPTAPTLPSTLKRSCWRSPASSSGSTPVLRRVCAKASRRR